MKTGYYLVLQDGGVDDAAPFSVENVRPRTLFPRASGRGREQEERRQEHLGGCVAWPLSGSSSSPS